MVYFSSEILDTCIKEWNFSWTLLIIIIIFKSFWSKTKFFYITWLYRRIFFISSQSIVVTVSFHHFLKTWPDAWIKMYKDFTVSEKSNNNDINSAISNAINNTLLVMLLWKLSKDDNNGNASKTFLWRHLYASF